MNAFPEAITGFTKLKDGLVRAKLDRRELLKACRYLRDELGFEHMSMISAVEYDDRFEIVYHITSYQNKLLLELITRTRRTTRASTPCRRFGEEPTGRNASRTI